MSLTSLDIYAYKAMRFGRVCGLVGYEGLVKRGYEGLDTLIRAAFLRPVQIVRQTISNLDTQIRSKASYHRYEGLSIAPQNGGGQRRIHNIPIGITNHISLALGICGYEGLRFDGLK